MEVSPGLVFVVLVLAVAVTLYFFIKARHAERMAMIEKVRAGDKKAFFNDKYHCLATD